MNLLLSLMLLSSPCGDFLGELHSSTTMDQIEETLRVHQTKVSKPVFDHGVALVLMKVFGARRSLDLPMAEKERFFNLLRDLLGY